VKHPATPLPFESASVVDALHALMRGVAESELMPRFRKVAAERKHDGTMVTEADRRVEAALAVALPALFDAPVLGEEMAPAISRTANAISGSRWR
jgi:myo-inositol-1(or 4)-monophosphatase